MQVMTPAQFGACSRATRFGHVQGGGSEAKRPGGSEGKRSADTVLFAGKKSDDDDSLGEKLGVGVLKLAGAAVGGAVIGGLLPVISLTGGAMVGAAALGGWMARGLKK